MSPQWHTQTRPIVKGTVRGPRILHLHLPREFIYRSCAAHHYVRMWIRPHDHQCKPTPLDLGMTPNHDVHTLFDDQLPAQADISCRHDWNVPACHCPKPHQQIMHIDVHWGWPCSPTHDHLLPPRPPLLNLGVEDMSKLFFNLDVKKLKEVELRSLYFSNFFCQKS